jgi:hypothetical protein
VSLHVSEPYEYNKLWLYLHMLNIGLRMVWWNRNM